MPHLTTMRQSVNSWTYADVERYEVNPVRGEVTIGQETYKLTSNTQYLSEGMKIELMDLNPYLSESLVVPSMARV